MTQSTELLPTQADRDAAADWLAEEFGQTQPFLNHVRHGLQYETLIEAFAKHRIEHSTPARNAVHDLIGEAYQRGYNEGVSDWTEYEGFDADAMHEGCAQVQADFAPLIRALTTTPEPTAGVSGVLDEARDLVPELRDLAHQWSSYGSAGRAKWLTRSADLIERLAALRPSPVLEVAKEALEDARLFVELVRAHWGNLGDDDQVKEAADCLRSIDTTLQAIKEGEAP